MKFRAILSSKAHPGCRQATKAVQDCGTSVVTVTAQDQHSTAQHSTAQHNDTPAPG